MRAQPTAPSLGDILLLSNSAEAGVSSTLRDALQSADPAIRTVAGRVVAASGRGDLRAALIGALARERDSAAGAELIRDILHLSGAADVAFIEPQSKRLGGSALVALAEWFARTQPAGLVDRLSVFSTAGRPLALAELVVTAARQHPEQTDRLLRGWLPVAAEDGWDSVLRGLYEGSDITAADVPLFVDALNAPTAAVRQATVWFVVDAVVSKLKLPAAIVDAAAAPREGAGEWEAFGRELIARRGKPATAPDRHGLIETEGPAHAADIRRIAEAPQLTPAERRSVSALASRPRETFAESDLVVAPARTARALVPGVIAGTLAAAGCHADTPRLAQAQIAYAPDGFPLRVTVNPSGLSRECQAAWTAIARTTSADEAEPVRGDGQAVVLPLNPEFIACADAPAEAQPSAPAVPTTKVSPPDKIRDVQPVYPNAAMSKGIQGVVVLKGIVSARGCVSSLRLIRSIPYLDEAAFSAVSAWKYEPTLLGGVPVSVELTVVVNFKL